MKGDGVGDDDDKGLFIRRGDWGVADQEGVVFLRGGDDDDDDGGGGGVSTLIGLGDVRSLL
jgi:hypothetical protein